MNEAFKAILFQTLGYFVSTLIGVGIIAFLQRGFLFKFIIVKSSLGKKILVRVKHVTHWDYTVGHIEEGALVIGKKDKDLKRINNVKDGFYRSLNINMIDLDGEKWAVLPPGNANAVPGHDPEKQESLVTRALYRPSLEDSEIKKLITVVIILAILAIVAGGFAAYLGYMNDAKLQLLKTAIDSIAATQAQVVPTS